MPEDKGKSAKAPKSKSNDDFAPQLVKSKSEIPKNAVLKIDSDGGEYWEVETKHEETKKKMYPPSSGKKRTGTPRKKDPEKSSTFGSTIQRYKLPPPEVTPPKQTGLYGGISTYEKIDPAAQWGADYGITTFTFPDEYGRYTNTSRTTNIDKEGREIAYDLANPLNSFKDGKFTPTYTGRTIDDVRNEWSLVGMSKPTDYSGNKANPDYKGSLMMPGTKATRVAGGGGGEFNQRNIANVPNALDKVPIGYIEQKYDTQGNPIVTPNVGVQMDTKNITPLRKGEMEVGRMYNIENPIEIKGKFAKGGIVSKIKGYYDGGPVYNPNMNIDGTYGDSNSSYKPIDTFGSGVVGMNDQYTAQNNMQAKKAIDENKKKANQQKARNVANGIGEGMGGIGSAYYNSQPTQNKSEATRNAGLAAVSQMGPIGGMIGGVAAIGDQIGKPIKAKSEKLDASGNLVNPGKSKQNAIGGALFSPTKALAYRSESGNWGDIKGDQYNAFIESKAKAQLAEVNAANTASKQQQAIAARNNQEENPTITNPYNLSGVTFDENQNMILADGQQFDKNRPMMNKGGVVGKIKNMYADGGDIKGKGTAKSDSIMAEVKEGSFVVPAENAELAKGIRKLYLKAPNKKANLKQEEGEAVKLSNGEHLFTPEENEYLESIGIDLEDLAPNSEGNSEEMRMGGYVVQRSGDREGKTHKVTGPDGTVKYFGDPNLGQHPKDLERKKAFYARHKDNLDNNPHFRAYARETWAEGGTVGTMNDKTDMEEYKDGGLTKSKAKIMLHEGMANGKPITEQQRKYFGWVAGGSKQSKMDGGKIMAPKIKGYAAGGDIVDDDVTDNAKKVIEAKKEVSKSEKELADFKKDRKVTDNIQSTKKLNDKIENDKLAALNKVKDNLKDKVALYESAKNKPKLEVFNPKENKPYKDNVVNQTAKQVEDEEKALVQRKKDLLKEYADIKKDADSGNPIAKINLQKKTIDIGKEIANVNKLLNENKKTKAVEGGKSTEVPTTEVKPKTATVAPKAETKPTVVTQNVPTTKPSLKAPKVKASKVTVDNLPTKDLSLQGLKQDADLKVANQAAMQEASIANAPTRQAIINDANVTSNENYLAAKPKSKNAWADKLSNIDPTAFVGIGQAALGLNMLGKEKRPIDKAVIDPTYNAAVNRAQQDALFGLTPEQRFMAEQDIQGGLNDAKMAGLNASGVQSFNLNRAAINDAWRNKLGLKQADSEMRMNKQKYADVMAADRATILAANRRQAYNDAMNTFQQKQQAGSELIGAGLANTIGAYRFRQDQQARLKADEARGYSLNNYNPTT